MSESRIASFAFAIGIVCLGLYSCSRWVSEREELRIADNNHYSECISGNAYERSKVSEQRKNAACDQFLSSGTGNESMKALALIERSTVYSRAGKCEAALQDAQAAFKFDFARPSALRARGEAKFCKGDTDGAVVDLTLAIDSSSDAPGFYEDRAAIYDSIGEKDKSIKDKVMAEKLLSKYQ